MAVHEAMRGGMLVVEPAHGGLCDVRKSAERVTVWFCDNEIWNSCLLDRSRRTGRTTSGWWVYPTGPRRGELI